MSIHHLTLWVPDLDRARTSWGWLLGELGYVSYRRWDTGEAWSHQTVRLVLEQSPDMVPGMLHSRLRPGMNHLAFDVPSPSAVDLLAERAPDHGWQRLYADRKPHALPPDTYAAYLEDSDGFEVELVAPA
jgi:catechol 2,3-dioxygenase-like lactoylglutathione lyase family enzyme